VDFRMPFITWRKTPWDSVKAFILLLLWRSRQKLPFAQARGATHCHRSWQARTDTSEHGRNHLSTLTAHQTYHLC